MINNEVTYVKTVTSTNRAYLAYRKAWIENPTNNIVSNYPLHITMELNNDCNLKCSCCPHSFDEPEKCVMSDDLKQKIWKEIDGQVPAMNPNYMGEPLLHPGKVLKWLKNAKDHRVIETRLNTNGLLLDNELFSELVVAGLDLLSISIDGEYHNNLDVVLKVKRFQELKKLLHSETPIIRLSAITEFSKGECIISKDFDEVITRELRDLQDTSVDTTPLPNWRCEQLWQKMFIKANGDVQPCCGVSYEDSFGSVKKDSIYDLWHDCEISFMRSLHARGESHKIKCCSKCALRKQIVKEMRQ